MIQNSISLNIFHHRSALLTVSLFLGAMSLVVMPDLSQAGNNWSTPVTPFVHEKGRRIHAKELLDGRYLGSWAERAEAYSGFMNIAIQNEILRQLPKSSKREAQKLASTIIAESKHYGLDPVFVLAVIKTESRFRPMTVGKHGEIGLMQIKPETARWIARKTGMPWYGREALFNVSDNIRYGLAYMSYLRKTFSNNPKRYLNAYNMGAKNVRRLIASESSPKIYSDKILGNYNTLYARLIIRNLNLMMVANFDSRN